MYDEQDHQFFDILYQQWSKTTGAETTYWMPEDIEGMPPKHYGFGIFAVDHATGEKKLVASDLTSEDVDFICGLHGAIPDLIRRLHEAVDEAVRKDEANDIAQGELAEALLENHALREQIRELEEYKFMYEELQ